MRWGVGAVLFLACAMVPASASASQQADCSMEAALEVAAPISTWGPSPEPIAQVLCGPFTGPGSVAMAVTFSAPTCWSPQGWAVFRHVGGAWEEVFHQPLGFLAGELVAAGGEIRVTQPVHRKRDSRCNPTGGTRARNWSWDGASLVPGPWEQVTPGAPRVRHALIFGLHPAGLACEMIDDGTAEGSLVHCWIGTRGRGPRVKMGLDGRLDRKARHRLPLGLGGRTPGVQRAGRFVCRRQRLNLRCIVAETGEGFLFTSKGARRAEPRTFAERYRVFEVSAHEIVCQHVPRVLLCSAKGGLKPPPPKVDCEFGGYNDRLVTLGETGRADVPKCTGDPGPLVFEDRARELPDGARWRRGGFRCRSRPAGLTCTNNGGHGFFLSRDSWRRF
jgi:hypothetical protein